MSTSCVRFTGLGRDAGLGGGFVVVMLVDIKLSYIAFLSESSRDR